EPGAAADDLLEVVDGLDLLLEVGALELQALLLALEPAAFAEVAQVERVERPAADLRARQRPLELELLPVEAARLEPGLAEAERLPSRPDVLHGLRERAGGRRGAEAHDGGADHLRRGAAEDPLRRRVEEHDPSLLVGHDD